MIPQGTRIARFEVTAGSVPESATVEPGCLLTTQIYEHTDGARERVFRHVDTLADQVGEFSNLALAGLARRDQVAYATWLNAALYCGECAPDNICVATSSAYFEIVQAVISVVRATRHDPGLCIQCVQGALAAEGVGLAYAALLFWWGLSAYDQHVHKVQLRFLQEHPGQRDCLASLDTLRAFSRLRAAGEIADASARSSLRGDNALTKAVSMYADALDTAASS